MSYISGLASKGRELFNYTKDVASHIIPGEKTVIGRVARKTAEIGEDVFQGVAPHLVRTSSLCLSKGRELFNYTKDVASRIIPGKKTVIGRVARKTAKIGKGVFWRVAPHLVRMSSMYLSKMTNLRLFAIYGHWQVADRELIRFNRSEGWLETATKRALIAASVIGIADLYGLTPLKLECRVAVDSLHILVTVIGSSRSIYEGANRMFTSWSSEEGSTTSKVSGFVSGAILATLGAVGVVSSFQASARLVNGINIFQTLDPHQQEGVLSNRATQELGGAKSCKAVIIHGNFALFGIEVPSPMGREIYKNCETRSYKVDNPLHFCEALSDAKSDLGGTIDVFASVGHADNTQQLLGSDYSFRANQEEISCMKEVLSPEAQVFSLGCNTAALFRNAHPLLISLIKKLSEGLPGREIIGFSRFYNPLLTTTNFSNGRFHHNSYFPKGEYVWSFFSSTVIEKQAQPPGNLTGH